jgi:hypothetical protein
MPPINVMNSRHLSCALDKAQAALVGSFAEDVSETDEDTATQPVEDDAGAA